MGDMTVEANQFEGLINEFDAAEHMGLKVSTMRKYRLTGDGPKFIRISPRCIRYRRDWLDEWANARVYQSTSAYPESVAVDGAA